MKHYCAGCKKTVYPVEQLNVLDKTWHKLCFNCEECGVKLTMQNYKGYNKLPYCNTHYQTTKFTAEAEAPENLRRKKNTQQQSSVYHKDFEAERGKWTAVADDPETLRIKKSTQQSSDASGDGVYVADDPETLRIKRSTQQAPEPSGDEAYVAVADDPETLRIKRSTQQVPEPSGYEAYVAVPSGNRVYVALYDYAAADDDEVSFFEGDIIINGDVIDDGWMTGTVERTCESGLLPSNYVEPSSRSGDV